MSQITLGSVQISTDSARVVASADADWSTVTAGSFFVRGGQSASYQVASVLAPGASPSLRWEVNLTAPYAGAPEVAAPYAIHVGFTAHGFPILTAGDTQTVALFNRLVLILEAALSGAGFTPIGTSIQQQVTTLQNQVATLVQNQDSIRNATTGGRTPVSFVGTGAQLHLEF